MKKAKKKNDSSYAIQDSVVTNVLNNYKALSSFKKTKPVYTYKGRKNKTEFPEFIDLCKKTQKELIDILPKKLLEAGYTDIVVGDGYIYSKGTVPVLLTAHMDTVHDEPVKDFYEYVNEKGQHILSSPQGIGGDDRCGIYMILDIIKDHKCSVLFCEDEESGGIGSRKFCKTELIKDLENMKYLIELDRANGNDSVFYDCDNPEFTQFIEENTEYKEAGGTFSDISHLAPECMVAAVNLSCGYYHAHTLEEEVVVEEMLHTIEVVKKLLAVECEQFEYVEANYGFYGYGYGRYFDDEDYGYESYYARTSKKKSYDWYEKDNTVILYVTYYDNVTYEEKQTSCIASSSDAAWFKFFQENPDTSWNLVVDYEVDYA